MKNIIIFPGSFDPIHTGHLLMAEKASVLLNADVIFVPAVISIWKEESAPFIDKINMIKLAIKNNSNFTVSDYENTTGLKSNFTVDTIKHFKKIYPEDNLFLLIGEDQVNKFHLWKDANELSSIARIIFFERPEIDIEEENVKTFNMLELNGILCDASSSDIRQLKKLNSPFEVIDYIADKKLYYMNKISNLLTDERLSHSIEVAKLARLIAFSNGFDISSAYIAGLLHDIGKNANKAEEEAIMNEHYHDFIDLPSFSYHQFIGEYISRTYFGIENEEILSAIKYHATGRDNMTPLGKIVYASDKIEPTRGFDSTDLIKACIKNYNDGFVEVLEANKLFLLEHKKDIENRLTKACFDQYLR